MVALVLLASYLGWRRRDLLRPPAGSAPVLIGFGLCVAAVNSTYYVAIDRLAVGVAISLQYTAPVLLLGLAALMARRAPGRVAWVAAGLTLAGAILVSRAYAGDLGRLDGVGLAAAVGSAFTFGGYLLTAGWAGERGVAPGHPPVVGLRGRRGGLDGRGAVVVMAGGTAGGREGRALGAGRGGGGDADPVLVGGGRGARPLSGHRGHRRHRRAARRGGVRLGLPRAAPPGGAGRWRRAGPGRGGPGSALQRFVPRLCPSSPRPEFPAWSSRGERGLPRTPARSRPQPSLDSRKGGPR